MTTLEIERGEGRKWSQVAGVSECTISRIVNGSRKASRAMARKLSAASVEALGRFIAAEEIRTSAPSVEDLI